MNPGPPKLNSQSNGTASIFTRSASSGSRRESSSSNDPKHSANSQPEPTLREVMNRLLSVDQRLANMEQNVDKKLDDVKTTMSNTFEEVKDQLNDLQGQCDDLKQENAFLRQELNEVRSKTDDLENRSRRNNILFYGIKRSENETNHECETKVKALISDNLGITNDVMFDRVHRTGRKSDSPIIARCVFFKDKQTILSNKSKLNDTDFAIKEDFSDTVRGIRKALYPHMKRAIDMGKKAAIIYDHLLIDGKKYCLNESGNGIFEMRRRNVVSAPQAAAYGGASNEEGPGIFD